MATRNTGVMSGIALNQADLETWSIPNNQRVELLSGERYQTGPNDLGSGVSLFDGNFANPIAADPDPQTAINTGNIATNTAAIAVLQADNPNNQTGTAYTLALGDENKTIWMNNAADNTVTVPLNATEAFGIDALVMVMMEGAGITKIQALAGVTLNGIDGGFVDIAAINSGATLVKRATDTWVVTGNISEVA